jgi:hypothetical protein
MQLVGIYCRSYKKTKHGVIPRCVKKEGTCIDRFSYNAVLTRKLPSIGANDTACKLRNEESSVIFT